MRRSFALFFCLCLLGLAATASAATGKIAKVLPHLLDAQGRHTLSPSLFDRDAYQAKLQKHPELCSGIRYDIHWRVRGAKGELKLRVELRGLSDGKTPNERTLEKNVKAGTGLLRWSEIEFAGEDFKTFGKITAWRVTLWEGDTQLAEQKSFLW